MDRLRIPLVVVAVLVLQTALVSKLEIAGAVPDAMLLLAVCAGVAAGSERGAVVGFVAGLAIDLYLSSTPEGLSALVFSLVGYAVGVVAEGTVRAAWWIPVLTVALGSAAGTVSFAVAAAVVSDTDFVGPHLAVVALVVAAANALLAPLGLRLAAWAIRGERTPAVTRA